MQEKTNDNYVKHVWLLGGIDHGNLGDHYIQEAMCEFLYDISPEIYIQEISIADYYDLKKYLIKSIRPADILVFCGGGNLGNLWPRLENLRRDAFAAWPDNPKIVFPQSIYFDETDPAFVQESIKTYGDKNCILALRDPRSYEIGKKLFNCRMVLTPDIVMYSDTDTKNSDRNGVLLLLRNDKESVLADQDKQFIKNFAGSIDGCSAEEFDTVLKDCVYAEDRKEKLNEIIKMISSKKLVITDRLHGMIFSAITRTPCIVLSNSYHKISSYISWVEDLPYITFCRSVQDLPNAIKCLDLNSKYIYPLEQKRKLFKEFRKQCEQILRCPECTEEEKVSVIIPVYNVDEYLKECLDSVARQTEKNIEIICVNDGSTDRSRDILSEYAEKDPRIIIIDQENRGLSGARNTGLREATGKYIYFADSDDYIAPNTIELCVQKMKNFNLEMLCFNAAAFCDNDIYSRRTGELNDYYKRNQIYPGIYSGKELLAEMKRNSDYIVPVWSYFYRRELLSDNDISFVEGIYYEDNSFTYECLLTAGRVSHLAETLYFRRVRENSITTIQMQFKHAYGYYACGREMSEWLSAHETDPEYIAEETKWLDQDVISSARRIYRSLSDEEKNKYKSLPTHEIVPFLQTIVIPSAKEGFTADLDARKIELEKQLNDSIRKLNECTKELHDIKNSKLYNYMVNLRSIKHKFTD